MRHRFSATLGLSLAAVLALGGAAYAGIQSIDTEPAPEVVVPASTQTTEPGGHGGRHGADDPATHDAGDDHGGARHGGDDHGSGHHGGGGDD